MNGIREAVHAARAASNVPVKTIFGSYPGHTGLEVVSKAADIVDRVRYVDIDRSLDLLLDEFGSAGDDDERNRWKQSGEELSKYELDVWERAGPVVQLRLIGRIKRLTREKKQAARGLLVAMLRKMLDVEITGTRAQFQAVTFSRGAIPLSATVIRVRRDAIRLLKF